MAECVREATGFSGYVDLEEESLYYRYKQVVANVTQYFRQNEWQGAARVFAALAWEPLTSIYAGWAIQKGKSPSYTLSGMNPEVLTEKEKMQTPILLLHGRGGSQGMFEEMGAFFEQEGIGPVFTVNLTDGELNEGDFDIVEAKIQEIQKLYGREVKIDLVGYSRGAEFALYMALPKENWWIEEGGKCYLFPSTSWRNEVGKVIRIGSMTLQKEWNQLSSDMYDSIYEIKGRDDLHMPEPSYAKNRIDIDGVGHVGLVSSPLVFEKLKQILRSQ
ncbi:MAG: hypothetical protein KDK71_01970 [Chlamydiia bacterium]|nr:hypothetical protein [Chlamydiia bacterium]